ACGIIPPRLFDNRVEQKSIPINSGDYFIFNTDGITESKNDQSKEYMERYFESICSLTGDESAKVVISHLLEDVNNYVKKMPQHDDMTLLCFKKL
ncbi:MAG: SpoIIE family protein phosphatase, partial [Spirochaetes bacterium]|nr:SpoIIE family protein phosphatase [Spirochaetota bacterium]